VNCRQASAHDDVIFSVALKHFRKSWEVQTAHPISGTGVIYLDKRGKRHAAPLKIADPRRADGNPDQDIRITVAGLTGNARNRDMPRGVTGVCRAAS
jgi:hypothetical protein